MKRRKVLLGLIASVCVCLAGTLSAQNANYQSNKLVEIGPDNIGGRVTSLIVNKHLEDCSELYAGAASGGLYTRTSLQDDIWKYIPCYINGEEVTLPISDMVKVDDNTIVIATGESYYDKGNRLNKMAAIGRGIFLFNPETQEFTRINGTNPGTNLESDFASVNSMAFMTAQGTTYFFVATPKGLFRWTIRQSADWDNTPVRVFEGNVRNVVVSNQYNRAFFSSKGNLYKISDVINGSTPVDITGSCPAFGHNASAIELAMAPEQQEYLYAMVADNNGLLAGIYQTLNTNSWLLLSTSTVTPFNSVATAKTCGALTVSPTDPTKIFVGGANVWVGKGYIENSPFQWTVSSSNENQLNYGDYMAYVYSSSSFVHSGIHQIVPDVRWSEEYNYMYEGYYIVTDGGVYYSASNDFNFIENFNRGMNNVQINSLAVLPDGSIISGANSNACPFIESRMDHSGGHNDSTWYDGNRSNTNHLANIIWKGNGGAVAASQFTQYAPLSRRTIFVSTSNGSIGRAYSDFSDYTNTQTWTSDQAFMSDLVEGGPAIGQISLWETNNNTVTNDSLTFTIDTLSYIKRNGERMDLSSNFNIQAGDVMTVLDPAHASYPFEHTFDHNFTVKNEMRQTVHQPYLSRLLAITVENDLPKNTNVSYCWFPTDFRKVFDESNDTRFWSHIYAVNGIQAPHWYVRQAIFSKDGDCVFVVVENDTLNKSFIARVHGFNGVDYRMSVHEIRDAFNYKIQTRRTITDTIMVNDSSYIFNRRISSIAVDPRDGYDGIIVTFDGYNNNAPSVAYISQATTNANIHYAQMQTPAPAYSALIEKTTGTIYVGTEDGIFTAPNINSTTWEPYGAFKGVPVTSMYQVTADYPLQTYIGHDGVTEVQYVFPRTKWANAIYFGTYGRGIFMDSTFVVNHENEIVTPEIYSGIPSVNGIGNSSVRLYPNPAVDNTTMELTLAQAGNVTVMVYDLNGKVVRTENLGTIAEGTYTHTLNCQNLQHGMYLVNVLVGNQRATAKLIVR